MLIAAPEDSADTSHLYKSSADSQGFVMNLTRAWARRPDIFEGFAALRSQLTAKSSLSKREQAVIVCATAAKLGDSYCSLAWGKTLAAEAGADLAAAVIGSSAHDGLNARDQALAEWARKVVADPNGKSPQDVGTLQAAGFTAREISKQLCSSHFGSPSRPSTMRSAFIQTGNSPSQYPRRSVPQ